MIRQLLIHFQQTIGVYNSIAHFHVSDVQMDRGSFFLTGLKIYCFIFPVRKKLSLQ